MPDTCSSGRRQGGGKVSRTTKLTALRAAADAGIAAIERGDCREFSSMDDLVAHLHGVAERAIRAAKRRLR